jgi:hypothetical protein
MGFAFFAGMAAHALFTRLNVFAYHGPAWGWVAALCVCGASQLGNLSDPSTNFVCGLKYLRIFFRLSIKWKLKERQHKSWQALAHQAACSA